MSSHSSLGQVTTITIENCRAGCHSIVSIAIGSAIVDPCGHGTGRIHEVLYHNNQPRTAYAIKRYRETGYYLRASVEMCLM
jgi:hypothetical protein